MSLHVSNPTAESLIHKQRRNAFITSATIAFLSIALVLLVLSLYLLDPLGTRDEDGPIEVVRIEPVIEDPPVTPKDPRVALQPHSAPAIHNPLKLLSAPAPSPYSVPLDTSDFPVTPTIPSFEHDTGLDIRSPLGKPDGFRNLPPRMKSRCSKAERLQRLKEHGGSSQSEKAVVKALDWLKQTQNTDGSWGDQHQVAMTGFAILAYLGHCETPQSATYGETVSRGLAYLVDIGLRNDGKLWVSAGNPAAYEHGIATYALAEAHTLSSGSGKLPPMLRNVLKQAGDRILDGQAPCGGWAYSYNTRATEGDNSVGFWQIQALKACKHTGIWPEARFQKPIRAALDWLERVQGPDGAIGYRSSPTRSPELTGGGALAFQIWDNGESNAARKAVDHIRRNARFQWGTASANLYYHYYNAQAMINAGGSDWNHYNRLVMDELVARQQDDGSWHQVMRHGPVNHHMATCLATMTLEVYYRFLPGSSLN